VSRNSAPGKSNRTHSSALCNTLQNNATLCNTMQHNATHCNTIQHTATQCNAQNLRLNRSWSGCQTTVAHCNALQHAATRCNTQRQQRQMIRATVVEKMEEVELPLMGSTRTRRVWASKSLMHSYFGWAFITRISIRCGTCAGKTSPPPPPFLNTYYVTLIV